MLPAPVIRPGEFHGLYSPWGSKELDMTEQLSLVLYSGFPGGSVVKNPPTNAGDTRDVGSIPESWVRKIPWRKDRLPIPVFLGFPCGSTGKESTYNVGNLAFIPGLGRSPGEGKGYPLQYSGLENFMDCIVHGVAESDMNE